jgi:Sugar (and other) transporter/Glycosyl hydrolase family 3 C-terminal domain
VVSGGEAGPALVNALFGEVNFSGKLPVSVPRSVGQAEGTAAGANWISNLVVSITFLSLVELIGLTWTFWFYGLLAIAAWIFCYYRVPETKGRSLEEIEASWHAGRAS